MNAAKDEPFHDIWKPRRRKLKCGVDKKKKYETEIH
jgi:hypothetical protein